jgi:hypothetical protein
VAEAQDWRLEVERDGADDGLGLVIRVRCEARGGAAGRSLSVEGRVGRLRERS